MNAHAGFKTTDQDSQRRMVVRRMVAQQVDTSWIDVVGGCDDCSIIPFDAAAAGRTRSLVLDGGRLTMRDDSCGSILG